MSPFQFHPQQTIEELMAMHQKLLTGIKTVSDMGDIEVGTTSKEAVYQEDKLTLYRYKPVVDTTNSVPLLIVYALVNRPYMLDLQPNRSLIKNLLETGQNIYLVDWGYPDKTDRYITLADYINGYLHRCVKTICKRHGVDKINVLGVCQGGTLSLCYSALYPSKVKNLITMVTPVDFKTSENLLSHWIQKLDVDKLVDTLGNIPGELLNWAFLSLKPFRLMNQKYLHMVDRLDDIETFKNFLRMEKWIFDSPDQAGEAFRQFAKAFYQQNALIEGKVVLDKKTVNLKYLTMPILNIYASDDHLVPPESSKALKKYVTTEDYSEVAFKGGHIGIYVSQRAQKAVPCEIGKWLSQREI